MIHISKKYLAELQSKGTAVVLDYSPDGKLAWVNFPGGTYTVALTDEPNTQAKAEESKQ